MDVTKILDTNLVPDFALRLAIRQIVGLRLREQRRTGFADEQEAMMSLVDELKRSPIAVNTDDANEQHYEVPARFYELVLGKHLKYSGAMFPEGVTDLDLAEEITLDLTCRRAELEDGQDILELGCGWGSLTLFMAERFRGSRITAVSNSASQRQHIERRAAARGLDNVRIVTADMNEFDITDQFDRVVSVEMFEHMRNYEQLMRRIGRWLRPDGRLFVHIFAHSRYAYTFEDNGPSDWMAREFFTGGIMPSESLLLYFQDDLKIVDQWRLPGTHYQKTAEAWLANMLANKREVLDELGKTYGRDQALTRLNYWKAFFLGCAELFGYRNGTEWIIAHYLFRR